MNGLARDRRSERLTAGLDRASGRWCILAVLIASVLAVFLDGMVLNVALPRIQRELGATQSQQQWIIAAYTLVFAVLLLPLGVVGDRFGRRRVLTVGLTVFAAGSIAGAYAATPAALITTRAATGGGAAAIVPATLAIVTNTFEGDERRRAIALWVAASGVAVVLGPLVGGALLDNGFWWGSVLLVNAPVVALGLSGVRRWVPESFDPSRPKLDILGGLLAVTGLGLVVFGAIKAGQTGERGPARRRRGRPRYSRNVTPCPCEPIGPTVTSPRSSRGGPSARHDGTTPLSPEQDRDPHARRPHPHLSPPCPTWGGPRC